MKLRVGIVGYGNLGHAVEKEIKNSNQYDLVAIFSRRKVKSDLSPKVETLDEMKNYKGKIDAMIMCGGSKDDIMWQSPEALKYFDIIDSFDTHQLIPKHANNLNQVAKLNNHKAIYSCGWDPGLFSLYKLLGDTILNGKTHVFWGKGVSQGHSDALRRVEGVEDAIQYTVPNKDMVRKAQNINSNIENNKKHSRVCYVAIKDGADKTKIEADIRNIPYYFKDQEVIINFVSKEEVKKLKKKMFHAGKVISLDKENLIKNEVKMKHNPQFTAKIMLAYANALPKLKNGAYSILEVPASYISDNFDKYL